MTCLESLGVVLPVDPPVVHDAQVPLEVEQEVFGWHCASSEEVSGHPALFVVVGGVPVAEHVNKEPASRLERSGHFGHERLVVLHVLKHLATG